MAKAIKRLRYLIQLDFQQRKNLFVMIFLIIKISVIVRFFPLKYYYKQFFKNGKEQDVILQPFQREIGLLLQLLKKTPWKTTCLMESLIIKNYLFKYNVNLPIRVGIKKTDQLRAHAWYNESDVCGYSKIELP